ncbi:MAG: helix-turn-helix domain-containing protein [Lachnospiraceae bacterium]|nr:helix-turn-helix domain-containing protein [Lachnospiraceae bacterium]
MRRYKRLKIEDRKIIEKMLSDGREVKDIAEVTGVHIATVYREIKRGNKLGSYSAEKAQHEVKRG